MRTAPREHGLWVGLDVRQRSLGDDEAGKERVRVDDDGTAARESFDHWDAAALRRLDVQHLLRSARDAQHQRLSSRLRAIPLVGDEPAPSVGAKQGLLELQHAQDGHVAQLEPQRARPWQLAERHGLRRWDAQAANVSAPCSGCPVGEAAEAMARSDWKKMGARNEDEALGIFNSSCTGRVGDAAGAA